MSTSGNHAGGAFRRGSQGQVVGVPTHSQPPAMPLTQGEEITAVGYDERWPGYVMCGSLQGDTGWVPESALLYIGPGMAVVRSDYTAAVLAISIGDTLTLHAAWNGWYWATRADGQSGWVLAEYVQLLDAA